MESSLPWKNFINIEEEMKSPILDYAMSVIVGGPHDVRDGLKPASENSLFYVNVE